MLEVQCDLLRNLSFQLVLNKIVLCKIYYAGSKVQHHFISRRPAWEQPIPVII